MEEQQLLRDPTIEPTSEIIAEGLGAISGAYTKFIGGLASHDIAVDWRYYNDGKAWLGKGLYKWSTARSKEKETTVFWLSVWEGLFKVTIFIPEKHRADALALSLSGDVKKMLEEAKQIGKLKFFPLVFELRTDALFSDVFALVDFKKEIK